MCLNWEIFQFSTFSTGYITTIHYNYKIDISDRWAKFFTFRVLKESGYYEIQSFKR